MRAAMIGSMPRASHSVGLAVLMRQGLAAWIDAVRQCALSDRPLVSTGGLTLTGPTPRVPAAATAAPIPADVVPPHLYTEIATLLAGVVLSSASSRVRARDNGGSRRC